MRWKAACDVVRAHGNLTMRMIPTLEIADAEAASRAAVASAAGQDFAVCIAVVDAAGALIVLHRMDGARSHTVDLALRKARTAALLGLPTLMLERMAAEGRPMPSEVVALAGGVPILRGGVSAGAIGVSGGSSEADHAIGEAGAAPLKAAGERQA